MGEIRSLEGLLQLAEEKSRAGRLAREVAANELIGGRTDHLSEARALAMGNILADLIRETEAALRARILTAANDMPSARPLAQSLATEHAGVAVDILSRSPVLRDLDLAETIYHRVLEDQLPATMPAVGPGVVERLSARSGLTETANAFAVEVAERSHEDGRLRVRLIDVEFAPAERTVWAVAAAVRMHALDHYETDQRFIDDLVEDAGKSLIDEIRGRCGRAAAVPPLVEALAARDMIDEVLLLEALDEGQIVLLEALIAGRARVRRVLVRRLFYEPGGECLAILCRCMGVSRDGFTRLFAAGQPARGRPGSGADLEQALTCFDGLSAAAVERIVRRWRRDPHYLDGLRLISQPVP